MDQNPLRHPPALPLREGKPAAEAHLLLPRLQEAKEIVAGRVLRLLGTNPAQPLIPFIYFLPTTTMSNTPKKSESLEELLREWQQYICELKHEAEIKNDHWIVYGYHKSHDQELHIRGVTPLEAVQNFVAKMKYLDETAPVDYS